MLATKSLVLFKKPTILLLVFLLLVQTSNLALAIEPSAADSAPDTVDTSSIDMSVSAPVAGAPTGTADPVMNIPVGTDATAVESNLSTTETAQPEAGQAGQGVTASEGDNSSVYNQSAVNSVNLPLLNKATGGLQYGYPIEIPPGRNGFQPDLELNYDNQSRKQDNIVGYGWDFNIPYIQRVNKKGTDRIYGTSTNFESSISGELTPSPSTSTTSFIPRTSSGDFLKYTFSDNQWTMTDKEGNEYWFGHSTSTRQDNPSTSTQTFKWMLEKVVDANNNTISYSYSKHRGQIYPSSINYTGNATSTGIFDISFSTSSVLGISTSSAAGFPIKTDYNITEIGISIDNVLTQKYTLSYATATDSNITLLRTITRSGYDGSSWTSLPATRFDYQYNASAWSYSSSWTIPARDIRNCYVIDINSDSLNDIICGYYYSGTIADHAVYINNGSGWTQDSSWTLPAPIIGNDGYNAQATDVNGDGLTDLIAGSTTYVNNGHGWATSTAWVPPVAFNVVTLMFIADVNGDGLPDLVYQDKGISNYPTYIYINTGNGWSYDSSWVYPYDSGTGLRTRLDTAILVDVNNDGLTDVVQSYSSSPSVQNVYVNNGHGWTKDNSWTSGLPYLYNFQSLLLYYDNLGAQVVDVNGDGLLDIVIRSINSYGFEDYAYTYINNGNGWTYYSSWASPVILNYSGGYSDYGGRIVDINGDGKPDAICKGVTSVHCPAVYLNNDKRANTVSRVNYPSGGHSTISYKASPTYFSQGSSTNPSLPIILDTVSQIVSNDGSATGTIYQYSYQGGTYYYGSVFDRKLAGFAKIVSTDGAGNVTNNYYHTGTITDSSHGEYQDNYWKIGQPYRTEMYDKAGNLYKKTINKWDSATSTSNPQAGYSKLVQRVELDYDGGTSHKDKAESYSYDDANGNQTQKIQWGEVTGSDNGTFTDTGTDKYATDISYASSATSIIISLPSQETVTDQNGNKIKENKYYYDSLSLGNIGKGNLTKTEQWKSGTDYVNTQKTYDGTYGLVTQTQDPRAKQTDYSYDSYHLYPVTVTNPLSQETQYTYNYLNGKVKETTDPNGNIFNNIYDGFGRILHVEQLDLTSSSTLVAKIAYTYTDTSGGVRVRESRYLNAATSSELYVYYDGLSRKIQERKEAEGTNYSAKDYFYDSRGLLQKESLPYFSAGSSKTSSTTNFYLYTTYAYDPLKRLASATNAIGTTAYSYGLWKTMSTDPRGKIKNLYEDAYGNLVRVDDFVTTSVTGTSSDTELYHTSIYNDANLVAYYRADDLTDSKGNNTLISNNSVAFSAGKFNNGFDFGTGNTNKYVSRTTPLIADQSSLTYSFWVKINTELSGADKIYGLLSDAKISVSPYLYYEMYYVRSSGVNKLFFRRSAYGSANTKTATYDVNLGTTSWHLITMTYDGATLKGYLDRSLVASVSASGNGAPSYTDGFSLGAVKYNGDANVYYPSDAKLDDVAVFSRALNDTEISNLGRGYSIEVSTTTLSTFYAYDGTGNLTGITDADGNVRNFTYDGLGRRLTADDLHASGDATFGSSTFSYDDSGNLTQKADPNGQTVNYTYDDINRPLTEDFTGQAGTEIRYGYDSCANGIGRLCMATSTHAIVAKHYDYLGNVASETKILNGTGYQTIYTYDRQGNVITITNPDDSQIKYEYNTAGLTEKVQRRESGESLFTDVIANFDYSPLGSVTVQTYTNGTETTNTYDSTKLYRLTHKTTTVPGSESMMMGGVLGDQTAALEESILSISPETIAPPFSSITLFTATATPSSDASTVTTTPSSTLATVSTSSVFEVHSTGFFSKILDVVTSVIVKAASFLVDQFVVNAAFAAPVELYQTSLFNDSDLVSYYRLDDTSDSKGINTLTNNSVDFNGSKFGNGADFGVGNTNKYLSTTTALVADQYPLTYSFWTKINTELSGGDKTYGLLSDARIDASPYLFYEVYYERVSGSNRLFFRRSAYGSANTKSVTYNVSLGTTDWHLITMTYDGATLKGYLDGSLVAQVAASGNGVSSYSDGLSLGAVKYSGDANVYYPSDAKLDDVAVFSRALSDAEISEMYLGDTTSTGTKVQDLAYGYDAVGNITTITDTSETHTAKIMNYAYDDLNRLKNASSTGAAYGSNYAYSYVYDALGNVLSMTEDGITTTYAYATNTSAYINPHAAVHIGNATSTYDSNGNLTDDGTWAHTWDYRNRLIQSSKGTTTVRYAYDDQDNRVSYSVNSLATTTTVNKYYEVTGATSTKNIYANGQLVATIEKAGSSTNVFYNHNDHLSGSNVITNTSGNVVQLLDYYPYGGIRLDERSGNIDEKRKAFGHEYDSDSELYYMVARYQNPAIGRFISQDPAARDNPEQFLEDPQQLNYYSYARNNPVLYTDPSGQCVWDACIIEGTVAIGGTELAIAALAGLTAATINYYQNISWDPGRQVLPNIYNPQSPDDTNLLPNGMPPDSPGWKKIGAIITGVTVLGGKIYSDFNEYKDSLNQAEKNKNGQTEDKSKPSPKTSNPNPQQSKDSKKEKTSVPQSSITQTHNSTPAVIQVKPSSKPGQTISKPQSSTVIRPSTQPVQQKKRP